MCGIGGILRRDGGAIPDEWLDAIDARIAHRGPDDSGRFRDRVEIETDEGKQVVEVALIHRRLSIIDLDGGRQPMISEYGRDDTEGLIAVVFNGCIYNHRELREELEAQGHQFTSDHSDTEVLIHGYRQWKDRLEDHLEGMYAFALWDRTNQSLLLARDWFGEKPLHMRWGAGDGARCLAFASDAECLARLDIEDDVISGSDWIETYLQLGYNHAGKTVYDRAGVHQVAPSIYEKHETLFPRRPRIELPQIEFEQLLEQAVERRLEADVPLGCFLSGGIDSSLIAYYAKKYKRDLHTFSMKMPDDRYDESIYAREVAAYLGTEHTTLEVTMDPAADLVFLIERLGQPFGDSSILPTYWVSRAAREHVTVAISGDGGDELFLGYDRYMAARALNRHRRLLKWIPRRWLHNTHPKSRKHKLGRLGAMARDLPQLGIATMESIFTQDQIGALLGRRPENPVRHEAGFDPMQSLRRFDLVNYLPDDLLCKVDTASMAVALEVRTPFLDRDLVRAALEAPSWHLAPGGKRKGLLRQIAKKYLPPEVIDRPKMGFAIPVGEWFRSDFGGMKALLLGQLQSSNPFGPIQIKRDVVDQLLEEHLSEAVDHSQRLFALLTLSLWSNSL
ncbi:MAG: asparagine synthase (glutamine-hydrolyzing) [Planctomycetes bacterium]|nr:asparagine synthase (glutamine-hydrolyzing) [Planctomycetota bacterium]